MSKASWRERFTKEERVQMDEWLASFEGTWTFDGFVGWLHASGKITDSRLREVLAEETEPVLVSPMAAVEPQQVTKIGRGAMGSVYLAFDPRLNRTVALKRMDPMLSAKPDLLRRFRKEVQITAQLVHPGIVPVHSYYEDEAGPAYTMKLMRGQTLKEFISHTAALQKERAKLDVRHALPGRLELFLAVCDAIAYAHSRGVIHRDLKPENVMVGAFYEVHVMDWGLARRIGQPEEATDSEVEGDGTQVGRIIGTRAYMSPEQTSGFHHELDGRADLFSLGVILFELVTLERAKFPEEIPNHPALNAVPADLRAVLVRSVARRPDDRYRNVEAFAEDIRRFLRDEAVAAAPDTVLRRVLRWISRHRLATLNIGLSLVLAVFLVGLVTLAAGKAALEASERAAAAREERLQGVLSSVGAQAHRIDQRLLEFEGILQGVAFAAEHALMSPAPAGRAYFPDDFVAGGPPDLAPSSVYGMPISVDWPDMVVAVGVPRSAVSKEVDQLASLHPALLLSQLRSVGPDAERAMASERRRQIAETGTPVVWAYVASDAGVMVGAPGAGEYPDDYDPRTRPWYTVARDNPGPQWGALDADESGMGLLITDSVALRTPEGEFLGVAAVDITFGYVIDTLLEPQGLEQPFEAFLVDEQGRVAVRSSQKALARTLTEYTPSPFEEWERIRGEETGYREFEVGAQPKWLAWRRLESVPWTYVIVGER